ncbi:MAG: E3 binding domain-containing protein [Chloroflexota bacterium]
MATSEAATAGAVQLAAEHDLDLADVVGTGADGRVTKSDVEAYLASRETADTAVVPDVAPAGKPETAVAPEFLAEVQAADSLQALIALGDQAADEAQRAAVRARAKELLKT